jgi:hypothetical protein
MPCPRCRFRPQLEGLESRLVPAITVTPFASRTGGPNDSIFIRGSLRADDVTLTDSGGAVAILDGTTPVTNPIPDPVIIRVALRRGADQVKYLVPSAVVLDRSLEYLGGFGRNSFLLDTATPAGTGVDLLAGSTLNLSYDGSQGEVMSYIAHFGDVIGSTVSFHLLFGAGNDRDMAVILGGDIEADSSITGLVDLGGGTTTGAGIANRFTLTVGSGGSTLGTTDESSGTSVIFDVLGGSKADDVRLTTNFGLFGSSLHPARVRFNTNLGGGADRFTFNNVGTPSLLEQAALTVIAQGGNGNDLLVAVNTGGLISIGSNATFDLNLFGGAGNDRLAAAFTNVAAGDFDFAADGLVRLRLDGNAGLDGVTADLANTAASSIDGVWDVQVLGSLGDDRMALAIADLVPGDITYQGGMALLDGGLGRNRFAMGFPPPGDNVRVLNV